MDRTQRVKTLSYGDRQKAVVDRSKCLCRIWNKDRLDNIQCSSVATNGDYCSTHSKKINQYGSWWLGLITEPRPEKAMGPPSKPIGERKHHKWYDQVKTKSPKDVKLPKKRDRPRKVKKEKCDEKENTKVYNSMREIVDDLVDDVIDPGIKIAGGVGEIPPKNSKLEFPKEFYDLKDDLDEDLELDSDSDVEDVESVVDFEVDGVVYKRLLLDDLLMDWDTGTQMAYLKDGKFVDFFDGIAKSIHKNKKQ